jgi:hypothetical protein
MRKGFEGLYAAVSEKLQADVKSGALFVSGAPSTLGLSLSFGFDDYAAFR